MDEKENEPASLVDVACHLSQDRRFDRVEELTRWIVTEVTNFSSQNHANKAYAANAFQQLLNESSPIFQSLDANQSMIFSVKRTKPRIKLLSETTITGSH